MNKNGNGSRVFVMKIGNDEYEALTELAKALGCSKKQAAIQSILIVANGVLSNLEAEEAELLAQ